MITFVVRVVGGIMVLLGALFTLQGLGVIGGSPMTGQTLWVVLGPVIAVLGLLVVLVALRGRKS